MPLRDALALRDAAIQALLDEGWSVRAVVALDRADLGTRDGAVYLRAAGQWGAIGRDMARTLTRWLRTRVDPLPEMFTSERRRRISARRVWQIKRRVG